MYIVYLSAAIICFRRFGLRYGIVLKTGPSSQLGVVLFLSYFNIIRILYHIHVSVLGIDEVLKELVLRLNSQFPGDVGVFAAFFLNHMKLKPGEAMFLAANLPHAYLSGGKFDIHADIKCKAFGLEGLRNRRNG